MEWYLWFVVGVWIGCFIGSLISSYFWLRYGDAYQLYLYKKWNNGEVPKYCLKCGHKLE